MRSDEWDPLNEQVLFLTEPKKLVDEELTEEDKKDRTKMFGGYFASGFIGLSMNQKHIFFWNNFHIWYMSIEKPTEKLEERFKTLSLYISPDE